MKLNFLNVLNKKSAPDEIAEQIVALEVKKAQCEKACDEAVLDLEIVDDSIEELNKQLYIALEAQREEESKRIIDDRHKWADEKERLMREVSRLKGRLVGIMIGIYHYERDAIVQLQTSPSFIYSNTHPHFVEFCAERDRALTDLKKPTPADLESDIQQKDRWLFNFKIENEYKDILNKYRTKVPSGAD